MKTLATPLPTFAARTLVAALAATLIATPLSARDEEEQRPVTDGTVTARDVAITPIRDLNLAKDPIPDILLEAQNDPYATTGLRRCRDYIGAVESLDAVLGPDFDLGPPGGRNLSVGGVAREVVGAFIPFRGVIRELSGANKQEQLFQDAIVAGVARRSFLKGMGLKLGCKYPARPADEPTRKRVEEERLRALEAEAKAEEAAKQQEQ